MTAGAAGAAGALGAAREDGALGAFGKSGVPRDAAVAGGAGAAGAEARGAAGGGPPAPDAPPRGPPPGTRPADDAGAVTGSAAFTTVTCGALAGWAGLIAATVAGSSGLPTAWRSAFNFDSNEAGGGGGAVCATTGLSRTRVGGRESVGAGPTTLARCGATGATFSACARCAISGAMRTFSRCTGLDCENAEASMPITAPAIC